MSTTTSCGVNKNGAGQTVGNKTGSRVLPLQLFGSNSYVLCLFQVRKRGTRLIFTPAVWRCTEKEEEQEQEECPAAEGEVDVNPRDQASPPHLTGITFSSGTTNN